MISTLQNNINKNIINYLLVSTVENNLNLMKLINIKTPVMLEPNFVNIVI
jgi:hypothetical protein